MRLIEKSKYKEYKKLRFFLIIFSKERKII